MYKELQDFRPTPADEAKIWRYMDFTKFVSLLDKQALFFTTACELDDPLEGFYPNANVRLEYGPISPQDTPGDVINKKRRLSLEKFKQLREQMAINCWCMSEFESAAMWKLYLESNKGIAVHSTYARLKSSFSGWPYDVVYFGVVNYIDYDTEVITGETWSLFETFLHKRKSYEYERELRAIIFRPRDTEGENFPNCKTFELLGGAYVSVCLEELIDKVYISPTAPEWFKDLVRSVMSRYDLAKEVIKSSLADCGPPY